MRSNASFKPWWPVVNSELKVDRRSRSRNLSMGTQIWSAFQTYNRVVFPNHGQNDHLPNYGGMVMVKGRDDNKERHPSGMSSISVGKKYWLD